MKKTNKDTSAGKVGGKKPWSYFFPFLLSPHWEMAKCFICAHKYQAGKAPRDGQGRSILIQNLKRKRSANCTALSQHVNVCHSAPVHS